MPRFVRPVRGTEPCFSFVTYMFFPFLSSDGPAKSPVAPFGRAVPPPRPAVHSPRCKNCPRGEEKLQKRGFQGILIVMEVFFDIRQIT